MNKYEQYQLSKQPAPSKYPPGRYPTQELLDNVYILPRPENVTVENRIRYITEWINAGFTTARINRDNTISVG